MLHGMLNFTVLYFITCYGTYMQCYIIYYKTGCLTFTAFYMVCIRGGKAVQTRANPCNHAKQISGQIPKFDISLREMKRQKEHNLKVNARTGKCTILPY